MTYEFRAFIPRNRHDSWSQDVYTRCFSTLEELERHLEPRKNLPGELQGIRYYKREVSKWEEVSA